MTERTMCTIGTQKATRENGRVITVWCPKNLYENFGIKGNCNSCPKGNSHYDKGISRLPPGEQAARSIIIENVERARRK